MEIFYLECLAQASYIISHQGKAFLVDPRRDVEAYLEVNTHQFTGQYCTLWRHYQAIVYQATLQTTCAYF